ncbi:MAG: redox-regulated ATPase YchF [Candidatus Liptonbacteria bacterium]|nr:redox-regulated ATPase YchF [Candidatus Liptonbacteria bacterium]
MKLSIGIVGLPNVGKSTLFKLLTKQNILIANYPFATIDPNVGVVPVADERLGTLAKLSNSKKVIPAVVEFYDIAGLVKGANKGEGLGNQFLSHIRECQAIVVVLRVFADSTVVHVEQSVDPVRDMEIINAELALKDLETVEKRFKKLEGEARTGDKHAAKSFEVLKEVKKSLEAGEAIVNFRNEEIVLELALLSAKRRFYLLNGEQEEVSEALKAKIKERGEDYIVANVALADEFPELTRKAYEVLGLISFFTTGEDETRAWTITRGDKAPQAAGVIHTDFEKNFIRAEVVSYDALVAAGGWNKAKEKGLLRLEGKDYVVQDGDVIVVRHG